jgi:hypothetical protein
MTRARMSGKAKAAARAELERRVEEWNRNVPVGTEVTRTDDLGVVHRTRTRSVAWIICDHASVQVEGIAGGYLLDRIKPVYPATARATGIDLDEIAKRAAVTIDVPGAGATLQRPTREIRLRAAQGMDFGPFLTITVGDLAEEIVAPALRAAAAAALEVLLEHKP